MIDTNERFQLFKYASQAKGAVVEMGAFFGASTACLAAGISINPELSGGAKLISIDAFKVGAKHALAKHVLHTAKKYNLTDKLHITEKAIDWLAVTRHLTSRYVRHIEFIQFTVNGSLSNLSIPENIDLLFLDMPKDSITMHPVAKDLLPKLNCHSKLIFQDYAYLFSDELIAYFELLEQINVIRLCTSISTSNFYEVIAENPSRVDWIGLLDRSQSECEDLISKAIKRCSQIKGKHDNCIIALKFALVNSILKRSEHLGLQSQKRIYSVINDLLFNYDKQAVSLMLTELLTKDFERM